MPGWIAPKKSTDPEGAAMNIDQRTILRLLDDLHELPVNDCRRFVELMQSDDPTLIDLAHAYRQHRISRHTYGQGVLERINDYFRQELETTRGIKL